MPSALGIALQGLCAPYPLTAIAIAVQGLAIPQAQDLLPAEVDVYRPPIVGRGPGTTINYSDFYKPSCTRPRQLAAMAAKRAATKRRQRMEDEVLSLLQDF